MEPSGHETIEVATSAENHLNSEALYRFLLKLSFTDGGRREQEERTQPLTVWEAGLQAIVTNVGLCVDAAPGV